MSLFKLRFAILLIVLGLTDTAAVDVGQAAPACAIASSDNNEKADFQAARGQVVYVDFWASWCGPCAKSFPFMNRLHAGLADKGLQIVAVNVDENLADAESFLNKQPAGFKVAWDSESECAKLFNVQAMPSTYLIDRKGVVRYVHLGFRESEAVELEEQVKQLLNESP
ncbi:MAG: TlpA family protein disulfide reductase [Methylomonas sp.]|jgi:thiol-disulfide isomerase/thioredoxin|uniref:TlpA family protein disulfide reductase n=1 Tax=Methylomonas sp. TaxID=418 RepID=UPI0025D9A262|nr:TlpA disulfide reductase family protein [Methylomonas sp.]MCK9604899.1 TlpA family protein disulfide reductase [Methylomonas sp.]